MKKINQIRESNDILFEMEDSQMRKLSALARAGLFDPKKINFIKRALDKDVKNMTSADKKALIELLDSLMAEVLGSTQVYSKVKQEVMKEAKKDYLSKYDPRFDKNYPSESDLPQIIILKRKAIRVYPDSQKVGLYYSQALDKYVSIPFGPGLATMSEETELNELSKSTYASAAFKATAKAQNLKKQADDEKDPVKKKAIIALQQKAKNLSSKASEKIKKIETDTKKTNDAEKEARSKIYRGEVNPVVGAAALAGVGARKLFDKFRAKRAEKKSAPEPDTSKASETKKDDTSKSTMSTSGKASATFEPQKTTQSKVTIEPKTKEPESKSDQPSDAGYEKVLATQTSKTKTREYQSHSAETIPNIKHGAPKKAGGVFLPPSHPSRSTSAQPAIESKNPKASFMKKLDEKKNVFENDDIESLKKKEQENNPLRTSMRKFFNIPEPDDVASIKKDQENAQKAAKLTAAITSEKPNLLQATLPVIGAVRTMPAQAIKGAVSSFTSTAAKPTAVDIAKKVAQSSGRKSVGSRIVKPSGKRALSQKPNLDFSSGDSGKDISYEKTLEPAGFSMKVNLNKPGSKESSSSPAYEKRLQNINRKYMETNLKEEDEEKPSSLKRKLVSKVQFSMKPSLNKPISKGNQTAYDRRLEIINRQSMQQNESVIDTLRHIKEDNKINIHGKNININSNISEKIISVYDALSEENKKKMETMLNESIDSFKKVINFAAGQ